MDINAKGVFLGIKAAIPAMRQAGGGSIIKISCSLGLVGMDEMVNLDWQRFSKLTEARSRLAKTSCVYIQAGFRGRPIRVGKASEGLEARCRGGTGYAIEAAMPESGNLV